MYEVIPKGTRGIFQLIYIPYDDILTKRTNLEKEINYDIEFIEDILRDVLEYAGMVQNKLGWGRGNIDKNGIKCFKVSWGSIMSNLNLKILRKIARKYLSGNWIPII